MASQAATVVRRSNGMRNVLIGAVAVFACGCFACAYSAWSSGNSPEAQATRTARAVAQATDETRRLTPSRTPQSPSTKTAGAPTASPTPAETDTPGPSPTPTDSPLPPPTETPNWAGASAWLEKDGRIVGVKEVWWGRSLGYYGADDGKTFISLYILAINHTDIEWVFDDGEFRLIDGGGEVHNVLFLPEKSPPFDNCKIQTGGTCEGWWTTQIWNRDEIKASLTLRWDPGLFDAEIETAVQP